LMPFTVNHLGGLGTLGHRFLFGPDSTKAPDPHLRLLPNSFSCLLYARAYGPYAPVDLLR
jgi:hypothetical protein